MGFFFGKKPLKLLYRIRRRNMTMSTLYMTTPGALKKIGFQQEATKLVMAHVGMVNAQRGVFRSLLCLLRTG
jgi:hypothetical protein